MQTTTVENSLPYFPVEEEIAARIERIQGALRSGEAVLVASNTNVFYTAGRFFRGYTYIHPGYAPVYFVIRPTCLSGKSVVSIRKPEQIMAMLAQRGYPVPERIGLELGMLTYAEVERLKKCFSGCELFDATQTLRECRMVKSSYEIEQMRFDGKRQAAAYAKVPSIYRPGMTDLEFQIEIERLLRLEGALGRSRVAGSLMEINMGSVVAGDNADVAGPYEFTMGGAGVDVSLPVGANGTRLENGMAVMVDMNGCFNGYQTDMTRVWSIGKPSPLALKAHECSIKIMRHLERMALPGVEVAEMYSQALAIVEENGLKEYFMGYSQQAGFIGHGIGIELNEQPAITQKAKTILREGMTLAIEPKFVIPGVGAVGIENTYVVRNDGLENLTQLDEELRRIDS